VVTPESMREAKPLDEPKLAAEIHAAFGELVRNMSEGEVMVFETEATWRYIATQVVLRAEVDGPAFRDACTALQSLKRSSWM